MRDSTPNIKYLARECGLFPLPLRTISFTRDGIRPAEIKDNRLFVTNAPFLKSLVPGKGASKTILSSELYGKIG